MNADVPEQLVRRPEGWLFCYRGRPVRAVDGDTVDAVLDLGFYLTARLRLRLYAVDAAEPRSRDEGKRRLAYDAKRYVERWFAEHGKGEWPLTVWTEKADAFGRWLAVI